MRLQTSRVHRRPLAPHRRRRLRAGGAGSGSAQGAHARAASQGIMH
jgi:hypothetical protein